MAAGLYDITTETLGKGHFAIVKLAKHCLTGESVAIKIIDKARLNKEGLHQLGIEIRLWSRLSEHEHPNVVKLYQVIDTRTKLYLVMEYCGRDVCDLYDYIQKRNHGNGLRESEAKHIFKQICSAISYCHSLKIVHRDLKPENILIITQPQEQQLHLHIKYPLVKLIDFGFSNQWADGEMLRTSCGSLAYSAPEILLGDHYDGPKVDIWGLGCILYILLYGNNPFMQINDSETLCRILDCTFSTPPRPTISEYAISLIKELLKRDPNMRLPIQQVLGHPWIKDDEDDKDFVNPENIEHQFKAPFTPKASKNPIHDRVIDQMISKGMSTSRDHIENALEKTRGSDSGNRTSSPIVGNNDVPVNGEKGQQSTNHEHYIRATYHLLKDKLIREINGFTQNTPNSPINTNIHGQFPTKKMIPFKPRKHFLQQRSRISKSSIQENDNGESEENGDENRAHERRMNFQQLEIPSEDDGLTLPLARKCSIVSEEGSCAADGTGSETSGHEGPIHAFHHENLGIRPFVDIIVTDCSEVEECENNSDETLTIEGPNDETPNIVEDDHFHNRITKVVPLINPSTTNIITSSALHLVSSSPELLRGNEDPDTDESDYDNYTKPQQNYNRASNMILSNDKMSKTHDTSDHFFASVTTNNPSNVTSMRVITQSKSYNNILFIDNEKCDEITEPQTANVTDYDKTITKKNDKTDRADCCIIC